MAYFMRINNHFKRKKINKHNCVYSYQFAFFCFYAFLWDWIANFIGMKITANKVQRPPRLGIVEKQVEWNFTVIKYPHASSNIP